MSNEQQKAAGKFVVRDCSSKEAGTTTCYEDFVLYQDQAEKSNCFGVKICRELVEDQSIDICCGSKLLKREKETL